MRVRTEEAERLRRRFEKLRTLKEEAQSQLKENKERLEIATKAQAQSQDGLALAVKIGAAHRNLSMNRVQSLVTSSLKAVYNHDYTFHVDMQQKRGQLEKQDMRVTINRDPPPVVSRRRRSEPQSLSGRREGAADLTDY